MPEYETIHKYVIVAQFRTKGDLATRSGRVVLMDKFYGQPEEFVPQHSRYITAWQGIMDDKWDLEWSQGNYFADFRHAFDDFIVRCKRWFM